MIYTYWFVRYYPNRASDEFVNIALIVGADGRRWHTLELSAAAKIKAHGGAQSIARMWVEELSEVTSRNETLYFDKFVTVAGFMERSTVLNGQVRLSPPNSVVAETAQDGAQMIARMIANPRKSRRNLNTRRYVKLMVNELFFGVDEVEKGYNAFENPQLVSQNGDRLHLSVDATVGLNEITLVCDAWGLAASNERDFVEKIAASCFRYDLIRRGDIYMQSPSGKIRRSFAHDVTIVPVYREPESRRHEEFLSRAQELWDEAGVQAIPLREFEARVDRITLDSLERSIRS